MEQKEKHIKEFTVIEHFINKDSKDDFKAIWC